MIDEKVKKATLRIIQQHPFFASLLLRLKVEQDASIPTAATDGKFIKYNPEFFEPLSIGQIAFVLAHEVLHCTNLHHLRRGNRDPRKFNVAADYAINPLLIDCGFEPIDGCLLDPQYRDKTTEKIYELLPDNPQDGQTGGGEGEGYGPGIGDFTDGKDGAGADLSPAEAEREAADWKVAQQQAAQAAKMQGKLPGALKRLVEDNCESLVDWREVLRNFISETAKNDYSWSRPNRRYISRGLYLPSLQSPELKPLIVAIDTSGSIGSGEIAQFQAELNDILGSYPCTVHLLYVDSRIAKVEEWSSEDYPVKIGAYGGGGTDFRPVFEWADYAAFEPAAIIYLTDLYGPAPDYCGTPTLWVSTTKPRDLPSSYLPKFGEIAYL